ncbi:hypothetical protein [Vibrio phage phiKT1028]|nr:hypothetical protein [Vibrio phage phiKT1028]
MLGLVKYIISRFSLIGIIVLIVLFSLLGCSSQPSFEEGSAQLKVETEIAKLDVVRANVGSLRSSVTDIPAYLKEDPPVFPPSELERMKTFLDSQQCEGDQVPKQCLLATVIYSIELANRADSQAEELHGAKVTVNQLIRTLDRIYAILDDKPPNEDKEK